MFHTVKLARLFGVDIYLHWTLWPILIYFVLSSFYFGGVPALLSTLSVVAVLFASVLLHELGHSLAARSVDVRTRDILLMPVGGIARLEGAPFPPKKELWITAAGPLVNLAIAVIAWPLSKLLINDANDLSKLYQYTLLDQILVINLVLGISNLIPAIPLDGGRVFRSIVAMRKGHLAATKIAARLSRWVGLLMIVCSLFTPWWLPCIAFGIYLIFASTQELLLARLGAVRQATSESGNWPDYFNPSAESKPFNSSSNDASDTVDAVDVRQI